MRLAGLLAGALLPSACGQTSYPQLGIHTGDNRLTWPNGCCEGDLIVIDFRDEQHDGNGGSGILYLNNTTTDPPTIETHRIEGMLGYTWKSYGPFCAYEGVHNFTFTSDANPSETSYKITDSFGLVKAEGGMDSFPARFYTMAPSKFCTPEIGTDKEEFTAKEMRQRNQKLVGFKDQYTPRNQLLEEGWGVPQDRRTPDGWPLLTVHNNNGTSGYIARHGQTQHFYY